MKILFLYDVADWSFHNIARNIAAADAAQGGGRQFRLMSREDWAGRPQVLAEALAWADLHLFFWRFDLIAAVEMLGATPARRAAMADLLARKITLSVVYDHLYDSAAELAEMGNPFGLSDLNAVCSGTLARHYAAQPHLFTPDAVLIDGVDLNRFSPGPAAPPGPLRAGWVGNSEWGAQVGADMKGFRRVFLPAIEGLEGVRPHIADRATAPVSPAQMPDFYRDMDVLVCTSLIEGTPNPVLEAMASGAAVVSTDVGVVRDVLGPLQRDFIIPREADALRAALLQLAAEPALLAALKAENLARREGLSWHARWRDWSALFDRAAGMLADPTRIEAKRARILSVMTAPKSRLARIRRRVMASPIAYALYMRLMNRYPRLLAKIRNRLR